MSKRDGAYFKYTYKIFLPQKNIIDTPIVKHPTATQGLNRSPVQQPYKL